MGCEGFVLADVRWLSHRTTLTPHDTQPPDNTPTTLHSLQTTLPPNYPHTTPDSTHDTLTPTTLAPHYTHLTTLTLRHPGTFPHSNPSTPTHTYTQT